MPTPTGSIIMATGTNQVVTPGPGAVLLTGFTANGQYSSFNDGDQSVQPDFANNRVLIHKPGIYEISFTAQVYATDDQPCEFDMYINGALTNPVTGALQNFVNGEIRSVAFKGVYQSVIAFGSTQDSVQIYANASGYSLGAVAGGPSAVQETLTVVGAQLVVNRIG